MFEYIVGKVNYINANYLILENNFLGYKIYVANPENFELNKIQKLFVYVKVFQNLKNSFSYDYYGFKSLAEKIFFEQLLQINGIGVKSALQILKNDIGLTKSLIKNKDVESLSVLDGFNNKIANAVIGQLSFKLTDDKYDNSALEKNEKIADLIGALKALGYKKQEVEKAIANINEQLVNVKDYSVSDLLSLAIKSLVECEVISN